MLPKYLVDLDPNIYHSKNYVVTDVETTNIDYGDPNNKDNALIYSSTIHSFGATKSVLGSEYKQVEWVDSCETADFIVAHNAKFELGWLKRCGAKADRMLVFDTMIAEYVLLGNRPAPLDLDSVCQRRGIGGKASYVSQLIKGGYPPDDIPLSWLTEYCDQDVRITHELFRQQLAELTERGLLPVFFTRCIFTPVLMEIEARGMQLDQARVEEEYLQTHKKFLEVDRELTEFTGGINPNSPKQVAEFLYDSLGFSELRDRKGDPLRTAAGGRKTDEATITSLKAGNKQQRRFIELYKERNSLDTSLSKYLTKFKECCENDNGILTANFNQCRTRTHRLSSSGKKYKIQFQNFDRDYKPLFRARKEGWYVGEGDGAQLEFRVAAFLGQDARAIEDIGNRFDVHSFTAATLTDAGQQTDRQGAKSHTFKPLYGGSSGTEAEQRYYQAFKDKYPGITGAQEQWKQEVLKTKQLRTATGLIFHWPDTVVTRSGYITNTTSICNYPVQMLATADIIPIAVTYLYHRMVAAELQSFLVNTIHDSAISEVHPDERDVMKELYVKTFTDDVYSYLKKMYGIDFNVPLEADVKFTTYWGEK